MSGAVRERLQQQAPESWAVFRRISPRPTGYVATRCYEKVEAGADLLAFRHRERLETHGLGVPGVEAVVLSRRPLQAEAALSQYGCRFPRLMRPVVEEFNIGAITTGATS